MINLKVKSIWQGKKGIRDKYVNQALKTGQDICISDDIDTMIIPYQNIQSLIVSKSDFPVKDKYSKESHYLIYFKWKPTILQQSLF